MDKSGLWKGKKRNNYYFRPCFFPQIHGMQPSTPRLCMIHTGQAFQDGDKEGGSGTTRASPHFNQRRQLFSGYAGIGEFNETQFMDAWNGI